MLSGFWQIVLKMAMGYVWNRRREKDGMINMQNGDMFIGLWHVDGIL
jgi:hypothetical protein